MENTEEKQYLNLIKEIINNGTYEPSRNGNTYSIFGYTMKFNLKDGIIPLLTTKKIAWKTCLYELFWFISGSTDNKKLKEKNVKIWNDNASREFLDSRGLTDYEEDDLGPIYSHQWRHFNAPYFNCHKDYTNCGIDQLQNLINQLKDEKQRNSRRLIITSWNPEQLDEMALPPCHVMMQFNVKSNKYLSCALFQRSGDVGLGVPFNIASYSFLSHILAKHCGLIADEFVYFLGNAHIYEEHLEILKIQILREPYNFPKINIKNIHEKIEDYNIDDIEFINEYIYHDTLKMQMKA
jgi:thymidylate synthase